MARRAGAASLAAVAALAFTGAAAANGPKKEKSSPSGMQTVQGLVQSISSGALVLRALDGSTATIVLGAKTLVLLNGKHGSVKDIQPGFVAVVDWSPGEPAEEVDAFGPQSKKGKSSGDQHPQSH